MADSHPQAGTEQDLHTPAQQLVQVTAQREAEDCRNGRLVISNPQLCKTPRRQGSVPKIGPQHQLRFG